MRVSARVLLSGFLSIALAGCGGNTATTTAPSSGNGSTGTTTNVSVAVTPASMQVIDAGQTVALTATVTGDSTNKGVTWSVAAGAGTLASTTGFTNSYTAPATAVASVTITATSIFDATKSASAAVTVNALPAFSSTGQLPQGYVGLAYSTTLASNGGTGTRTYALASGSSLPAGLSLNPATGVISGTPTATGSTTFSAVVTDSASTSVSATGSFTLGVSALQLNSPTLTNTVVGRAYTTATYTSAYAQGAVTYAVTAGSLPAGLTLSTGGLLSGTATAAGTSNFTVTATDAAGQKASGNGTIVVAPTLVLAGGALPGGVTGSTYAGYTFAATGGTAPYTYAVATGSTLPAGLTLSAAGVLSGAPTTGGTYTFSVTATDAGSSTQAQTATAQYTLAVTISPVSITTSTLPNGVPGSPYSQQLVAAGGTSPYTFAVASGALPDGLTLTAGGLLTGRPTALGTFNFSVRATDSQSPGASSPVKILSIVIAATLTPGTNNAVLKGSYAFVFTGQTNGALAASATTSGGVYGADIAGSLTFDGTSLLTGIVDFNSASNGSQSAVAVTGSYTVNADNRGQIVLQSGPGAVLTLDIAASAFGGGGVAGRIRMIEADSTNVNDQTQMQGSAEALLQTPSTFNLASLTGRYVFRLTGETAAGSSQFGAVSAAGYLALNGAGLISGGSQDAAVYGTQFQQVALTGTYTAPDAHSRGTLTITPVGSTYAGAPSTYVYYVVNAKQIMLMSTNPHTGSALVAGSAYQQQQTLYSTASLTGTVIASETYVQGGDGVTKYPSTNGAAFYVLKVTAAGQMSGYSVANTGGSVVSFEGSPATFTYSVSDAGRVTLNVTGQQLPVFWLYDQNQGVGTELHNTQNAIGTLALDAQTGGTFSNASVAGSYSVGTTASVSPVTYLSGNFTSPDTGSPTLTLDSSGNGTVTPGTAVAVTKGVEGGTGRFTLTADGILYNGYFISTTKILFFNAVSGFVKPVMLVGEQ